MGAIDGTIVRIKPPSTNEEAYVGIKEGHAINCQVICDINGNFMDAVVRWPGSLHDSSIWQLSGVKTMIESFVESQGPHYKGWLLGDSGYPQREIMMVPLLDEKQRSYNKAHKKCRCSIERAIGVLKSRFRCLCKKTIDYTVDGDVAAMILRKRMKWLCHGNIVSTLVTKRH